LLGRYHSDRGDEQARILGEGMEVLVGYLASVRDGWEDEKLMH